MSKNVTMNEFFNLLKKGNWDWYINPLGGVREKGGEHCPVSRVFNLSPCTTMVAPLSTGTMERLVNAADDMGCPKTRAKLLTACGLKEKTWAEEKDVNNITPMKHNPVRTWMWFTWVITIIGIGLWFMQSASAAEWKEDEMRHYTHITAASYNIKPFSLLEAVCEQETRFKLGQVSHKGAIGVCQIKPDTVRMVMGGRNPYAGIGKTFQLGSTGSDVGRIQGALNERGYNLAVDGVFGRATDYAVRDFQGRRPGLAVDGVVGAHTGKALDLDGLGRVTIESALRHPPTNIMWAAEVLTWCRSYLGRDEPGVLLSCYYSGPGSQTTRYLKEVFERIDRLRGK